jgi:hypothetical protein
MTPKLKLDYRFHPDPVPTTRKGEDPPDTSITVVVSDPGRSGVAIRKILIDVPAGQDVARAHTADPKTVTIDNGNSEHWTVERTSSLQISITPASGEYGTIDNSITFVLNDVHVGHVDGVVPLSISEYYPLGNQPALPTDDNTYSITKVPADFRVVFNADKTVIPRGGSVELFWQGPQAASYELAYFDTHKQKLITHKGKPDDHYQAKDVQDETLFLLHVTHVEGNDSLKQVATIPKNDSGLNLPSIAVAETASATKVYVTDLSDSGPLVIDASTNEAIGRLDFSCFALAYSKSDRLIYFVGSGQVRAIDVASDKLVGEPPPARSTGQVLGAALPSDDD